MANAETMELVPVNPADIPPESRCDCCPYGYHIDLDFLRYCESLNNGTYLRNLKKMQRNKRKQRKSMEVYMNNQQQGIDGQPPPDIIHSTDHYMNYFEHDNQNLRYTQDEMDNFDLINQSRRRVQKGTGDYDDLDSYHGYYGDYDSGSPSPGNYYKNPHNPHQREPHHKFRTETDVVLHSRPIHKSDSVSSLTSSLSEPESGEYKTTVTETEKHYTTHTHTYISAAQLAGQFNETLAIEDDRANITPDALKAIREQMAQSLERLKELEEQNKLIPMLQCKLSVLKEEKRMAELDAEQAKRDKDAQVQRARDDADTQMQQFRSQCEVQMSRVRSEAQQEVQSARTQADAQVQNARRQAVAPTAPQMQMPPQRPRTRTLGVGDCRVDDYDKVDGQLQLKGPQQFNGYPDRNLHDRELHTEESSHITEKEKEVHTLVVGQENRLGMLRKTERRVPTRSIGVGSGNVFDQDSNIHVHEKEMRTVIIGGKDQSKKSQRNVGVSCRATMRDVGIMYYYEDVKPMTRNVAVGVGEGLAVGELVEAGQGESHTSVHQTLTSLQQMNLAAFHSRNINIKTEHLRVILDEMLKKSVHSVGTMCKMSTEDKATSHVGYDMISVGCGSDKIDVEVREVKETRSVGIENRPVVANKGITTDAPRTVDTGVNPHRAHVMHNATNTVPVTTYPAMTNTEPVRSRTTTTETDHRVFQALDQIKHTACNTPVVRKMNSETNTEHPGKKLQFVLDDIKTLDKGINTMNVTHTSNRSVNTDQVRQVNVGCGDYSINQKVDCDICLVKKDTDFVTRAGTSEGDRIVTQEDQTQRTEITRQVAPSYTREVTVQSRTGHLPSTQLTKEITTETRIIGGRRSRSPSNLTQQQIMEQHLGMGNFEQLEQEFRDSEETTTTEETIEQMGLGQVGGTKITKEIVIGGRTGRTLDAYGNRGGYTREVTETKRIGGSGTGGYDREITTTQRKGFPDSSTSSTTVTEETVERTIRGGSKIATGGAGGGPGYHREVVQSYRSGYPEASTSFGSTATTTEETVERTISGSRVGGYSSSPGGYHITREITIGGRSGVTGGELEGSSSLSTGSSGSSSTTFSTVVKKETPGGVIVESKPSREERMKQYGIGSFTPSKIQTQEKVITARTGKGLESSTSSSSSSSSASTVISSTSAVTAEQDHGTQVQFVPDGKGGTQMKVVRTTETDYVGNRPVHSHSDVVLADSDLASGHSFTQESSSYSSSSSRGQQDLYGGTGGGFTSTRSVTTQKPAGRTVTVTETKVERRAQGFEEDDGSGLRSIMKKPGTSPLLQKKEIKFAEEVAGGYVTTSSSSDSEAEEEGERGAESDSQSSDSVSYDEGSYDGRLGNIVYQCKDDEAIAQGAPGATMFDQNIRETFELSPEMKEACNMYTKWLEDSSKVSQRDLNSSSNKIQQEWFKISSQKLSNPSQVEDFLSSFKEFSADLLSNVVNMTDANGNTALHYAVSHCNTDIVNLLLDSGSVDVDKQNKAGYTAVMLSSLAQVQTDQQRGVVNRLFQLGDVNARASQAGQTALMLAVSHGRMDMVKMLLESGADVNLQDDDGSTALMCACEHGHTELVKLLLSHPDCDPTINDNDGSTALSIAMEAGHRDVGVLLYAHVNFKQGSPGLARAKQKWKVATGPTSPRMFEKLE